VGSEDGSSVKICGGRRGRVCEKSCVRYGTDGRVRDCAGAVWQPMSSSPAVVIDTE
jgi:hypothetical protein